MMSDEGLISGNPILTQRPSAPELSSMLPRICAISIDKQSVGAVWLAHDRKEQVMSVYGVYKVAPVPALPIVAAALTSRCGRTSETEAWIPAIMDVEAFKRTKQEGATLGGLLADLGLSLSDARYDEEAGVAEMQKALQEGRLYVEPYLHQWAEEYQTFHRGEDGKLPPTGFHLLRATGLALMVEPSQWLSEAKASSDREGMDPGDRTRNRVTGY